MHVGLNHANRGDGQQHRTGERCFTGHDIYSGNIRAERGVGDGAGNPDRPLTVRPASACVLRRWSGADPATPCSVPIWDAWLPSSHERVVFPVTRPPQRMHSDPAAAFHPGTGDIDMSLKFNILPVSHLELIF